MKPFTILFPTEFGPLAEKATSNVMFLYKELPARLILMHALYPLEVYVEAQRKAVNERLEYLKIELGLSRQSNVLAATRAEEPHEAIVSMGNDLNANLVIFGTKGGSGLRDKLLGSAVNHVIRNIECPVLSIRNKPEVAGFSRILVPIDLQADTREQIEWSIGLARLYKAEIEFISIMKGDSDADLSKKLNSAAELAKRNEVEGVGSQLIKGGKKGAAELILEAADKIDADLICLMTQRASETGITKSLLGSVADKVVNKSQRAVMSIRPGSDRGWIPELR